MSLLTQVSEVSLYHHDTVKQVAVLPPWVWRWGRRVCSARGPPTPNGHLLSLRAASGMAEPQVTAPRQPSSLMTPACPYSLNDKQKRLESVPPTLSHSCFNCGFSPPPRPAFQEAPSSSQGFQMLPGGIGPPSATCGEISTCDVGQACSRIESLPLSPGLQIGFRRPR